MENLSEMFKQVGEAADVLAEAQRETRNAEEREHKARKELSRLRNELFELIDGEVGKHRIDGEETVPTSPLPAP